MAKKANVDVREELVARGVYQWQLADRLGIAEGTMVGRLRRELSKAQKDEYIALIKQIQKEQKE